MQHLRPTLPLSGRQGAWGGEAGRLWWPVHSRGLFEVSLLHKLQHPYQPRSDQRNRLPSMVAGDMEVAIGSEKER